jgi:RNA polymerase sigma-70 factor, ECF subfamily
MQSFFLRSNLWRLPTVPLAPDENSEFDEPLVGSKSSSYRKQWRLAPADLETRVPQYIAMNYPSICHEKHLLEQAATEEFLESPSETSFCPLFRIFTPQLTSFFRARGCELALSEDLAQEVMFTVYRKADQLRDRTLFRAWLFKIARTALCRHYGKRSREVETIGLENLSDRVIASTYVSAGTPAFEFLDWIEFLDKREQEALRLRFVEEWEYHEIAAAQEIPIGTVQWRVFNAKKKLAPHLTRRQVTVPPAA